jgi:pSer/pThr/pTyr-binding forkhead associated (FHA) protein
MSGVIVLALRILLVFVLYGFLGTALWIMWQELTRTSQQLSARVIPPIGLRIDLGGVQTLNRTFTKSEVTLGRAPGSDVTLTDAAVSARHALLTFHHGQWWIEDLGSRNGTALNAQRLEGPTVLTHGDEIACGQAHIEVDLEQTPQGLEEPGFGGQDD